MNAPQQSPVTKIGALFCMVQPTSQCEWKRLARDLISPLGQEIPPPTNPDYGRAYRRQGDRLPPDRGERNLQEGTEGRGRRTGSDAFALIKKITGNKGEKNGKERPAATIPAPA